jgi:hypothetical protein
VLAQQTLGLVNHVEIHLYRLNQPSYSKERPSPCPTKVLAMRVTSHPASANWFLMIWDQVQRRILYPESLETAK